MGLLGAHMSVAGGLSLAIERGDELKCEAIQIFVQSNRTWARKKFSNEEIETFRTAARTAKSVKSVVAHNSYLLNLSGPNTELREKSITYFIDVLQDCEALGIEGLITHPGSHQGAGEEEGIRLTIDSLNQVLKATAGVKSKLIIENTAGQGGCVGHSFDHLSEIWHGLKAPERVYFCFDTQHAFAAGYDLRTEEGYEKVFAEFDKKISVNRIVAFHLNDALKEFGCRVDRHQNIGKGFIGKETFRQLVNDPRFAHVPMCLETDPGEENENYRRELRLLRSFIVDKKRPN